MALRAGRWSGEVSRRMELRESVVALLTEIEDEDSQLEHLLERIDAAHSLAKVDDLAAIARTCAACIAHLTGDAKSLEVALMADEGHTQVLIDAVLPAEDAVRRLVARMRGRARIAGHVDQREGESLSADVVLAVQRRAHADANRAVLIP